MNLLSALLLCAAVLAGTGLPSKLNHKYPAEDAMMEGWHSIGETKVFVLKEETGDKQYHENAEGLNEETTEDDVQMRSGYTIQDSDNYFEEDVGGPSVHQDSPADNFDHGKETNTEEVHVFEGDILASREEILQTYDPDDIQNILGITINKDDPSIQAASSDSAKLWKRGIVPYSFHSSLSAGHRVLIRSAIKAWEKATCLHFVPRTTQSSYLYFRGNRNRCGSYVGRKGGRQSVYIGPRCNRGNSIHEIGHAVGFWHEQSRPDRDEYINILTRNIASGMRHNFMKRRHHDVDYQGTKYDYGSIMQYSTTAFSRCTNKKGVNCPTITVSNTAAYNDQGRPTLGQRSALSHIDILQANRLYRCPGVGVKGHLRVFIRYAHNLHNTEPIFNDTDPYVRISAVSSSGNEWTKQTSRKYGTTNPTFNQWIDFGRNSWQFLRIRVWDYDPLSRDNPMTQSQTIPITSGSHRFLKHCARTSCGGFLRFDLLVTGYMG